MLARSVMPWCVATTSILVLGARAANAACVISGVRPTVALPTLAAGQEFSFLATADCEKLRFRVPGTFVEIPKGGPDTGASLRTYRVVLTESQWSSLVDEDDTTFTWSIIGTTSAGVTTRVTTTNEVKANGPGVTIDLSMADAKLVGEENSDIAGFSISGAGDVNNDGHDDVLVGAPYNGEGGWDAGAAYLVLGPVTGTLDLSLADAKLVGEAESDIAGSSISGAGDVDNDGRDDLLVGAPGNDEAGDAAGAVYLLLGPVTGTLDLSVADAKLIGEHAADYVGWSVAGAGDVNGDGVADIVVGASGNDEGGSSAGAAYVVIGPVTGTLDLSRANAKLIGEHSFDAAGTASASGASVGSCVSRVGDADGDGLDDLLVGAPGNDESADRAGAAYLVLGPVTGTLDLSVADAKLVGEEAADRAGAGVSGAGDADGDGHDDLLVGAPGNDEAADRAGAAYVVLGPVTGTLDLSLADAKLLGAHADEIGYTVSGAGDVNGDGLDDVVVGTCWDDTAEGGLAAGAAYLVLGHVTGTLALSHADAKLVGEESGDCAERVSGAGDVDADGRADIMVGAWSNDPAGAAYLVYGGGL